MAKKKKNELDKVIDNETFAQDEMATPKLVQDKKKPEAKKKTANKETPDKINLSEPVPKITKEEKPKPKRNTSNKKAVKEQVKESVPFDEGDIQDDFLELEEKKENFEVEPDLDMLEIDREDDFLDMPEDKDIAEPKPSKSTNKKKIADKKNDKKKTSVKKVNKTDSKKIEKTSIQKIEDVKSEVEKKQAAKKKPIPKKPTEKKPFPYSKPEPKKLEDDDPALSPRAPLPGTRFSDEDLEMFKIKIQEYRKDAVEELQMLKDRLDDLTSYDMAEESMIYSMHMAEQGSEALEKEKTYAQIQRINEYIRKLDEAVQRIDDKTYGICRVCGCLIAKERLLAVPITTLSASYKIHRKCPEDGIDRIEPLKSS